MRRKKIGDFGIMIINDGGIRSPWVRKEDRDSKGDKHKVKKS